ncbi:hypothetical protein C5167_015227 [Papaver somniferum]|uniref:Uncharacterized protein n=1 Tax=Papaver somniferum TaxID=3469 RepID=A0A4Y7J9T4_PAPSO|nr:hypothetical protein C5167_015227 [Papaver somniferum]
MQNGKRFLQKTKNIFGTLFKQTVLGELKSQIKNDRSMMLHLWKKRKGSCHHTIRKKTGRNLSITSVTQSG